MTTAVTKHFYVDEAGDLTLMGRRGKSLLGTEGVSRCFMVGVAHIVDPAAVGRELEELRQALLRDPYLEGIPSMQPEAGKTALCFHAKDDCTEVRMAVFKLLARHDIKVQVGVRRKTELLSAARQAQAAGVRIDPNTVYDNIVKTIFKRTLHTADENVICFARRGKSDRQEALAHAIRRSKANFVRDTGIETNCPTRIIPSVPSAEAGLQVIDYFLWAVQRLYERGEDRYFNFLAPRYRLIMDFDDKRSGKSYGTWYSDQNPLTKEKMMPATS